MMVFHHPWAPLDGIEDFCLGPGQSQRCCHAGSEARSPSPSISHCLSGTYMKTQGKKTTQEVTYFICYQNKLNINKFYVIISGILSDCSHTKYTQGQTIWPSLKSQKNIIPKQKTDSRVQLFHQTYQSTHCEPRC